MNHVNFIPVERRHRRRCRGRFKVLGAVLGLYVGLVAALITVQLVKGGSNNTTMAQEQLRVDRTIGDARAGVARLQQRLHEQASVVQASRTIGGQPDWGDLLAIVADLVGEEIILQECRIDTGVPAAAASRDIPRVCRVELTGFGAAQEHVSQFVLALESTELFTDVRVPRVEIVGDAQGAENLSFRVICFAQLEGPS